jgi:hypothetical protein
MEWSGTDKLPGPGVIGRKLRDNRGRVVNGMALHGDSAAGGVQRWRVSPATGVTESGDQWE